MNELKPEDVMRALEHCAKHHINECKKCPYRNHNHCFGTLLADALALLREKDAEIERLEKLCEKYRSERNDAQERADNLYNAIATRPQFWVIEPKTIHYPDLFEIARNEEWAKSLCYCDMEGFAITEEGALILLDECGKYEYPPQDRFQVIWQTKQSAKVRAEAIDEFADALEKHFCHDPAFLGVEQRLIMDVVKQKTKGLKGGTPNA